ncbi:MAG TPA: patatin-like phospholipase family protein, partial [Candidatus Binataceae bacterium]|nr:patatin-like phospholipase family protein [Candidatus Binataceae bacterium]
MPADYSESTRETDRLKAIWSQIHHLEEKRAALCISGGGIRSATFGLGVLQGLANCGLLERFHFLSTVSGGGYIGGWLSAWIHRAEGGLAMVMKQLGGECDETLPNPEPVEIQNLRSYSNYLSPRLGLLSADSWTLIATYIRNLFLTSLVLLPLLAAFLTIPWCYATVLMTSPPPYTSIPFWAGGACVALAVIFMGRNLPGGGNKERNQNQFLVFCLLPLFLAAIFITSYWAWFNY